MKYIAILGGIALLGTFYYVNQGEVVQYERQVDVQEVLVDATAKRIQDAQDAEMDRINTEADQMRQEYVENELKKIESKTLKEIQSELEARTDQLDKESGDY